MVSKNSYCSKITWLLFFGILNMVTLKILYFTLVSQDSVDLAFVQCYMKFLSPHFKGLFL